MKVLHIITGLGDGGAEACLYRLLSTTQDIVCNSVICLRSPDKYSKLIENLGIQLVHLNFNKLYELPFKFYDLYRLIKEINPDIVQTWLYHSDLMGGICAKLAKKKVCWGVHNTSLNFKEISFLGLCLVRLLSALSYIVPDKVISCSYSSTRYHRSLGYDRNKFCTVHNGINTQEFYQSLNLRSDFRRKYHLKIDEICLGMIARNKPPKDYKNLISAISIIKKKGYRLKCFFVGLGTELLKTEIENVGLMDDVILLGQRIDICEILNGLDIFILSSNSEACPNVLLEAMACGVPCISTDVGDCKYLIGDCGIVVPPGDCKFLADVIIEMLTNLAPDQKIRCIKRIEQDFTVEKMVQGYFCVWSQMIKGTSVH